MPASGSTSKTNLYPHTISMQGDFNGSSPCVSPFCVVSLALHNAGPDSFLQIYTDVIQKTHLTGQRRPDLA